MYLVDALTVMARRWYVVLAGVLVLGGGAAAVVAYVPTTYQSSGQMVLLLPPQASGTEKPVNPYLNLQTGLTTAASLVSGAASTKDVEKEMEEAGFDSEYAVAVVPGTGPLISVTAKDSDGAAATATRDAVMAWIDQELLRIQDEVRTPRSQYISATRSSVSRTPEALPGSKLRALAALGAVVGLLTLALTFGIDRVLLRRVARRNATYTPVTDHQIDDDPATDHHTDDDAVDHDAAEGEVDADRPSVAAPDVGVAEGLVVNFHAKRIPPDSSGRGSSTSRSDVRRGPGKQRRVRSGR